LSGTLEIEADIKQIKQENEKLDEMILQVRNEKKQIKKETEQIKKDNERLAELESKIDSSFCKYGINSPLTQIPD
jgi:DNA repair ATPase RecN